MQKNAWRGILGAGLAAAMVLTASGGASAAVDTARKPQVLTIVGSDSTYEGSGDLAQLYNESPGCAVIPASGSFTNFEQKCIDDGQLAYASNYSSLIETENLYHDMVIDAFPTGSSNGANTLKQSELGSAALNSDINRSSSKQTITGVAGRTFYGTAYQRDGLSIWVGKNNVKVKHTKKKGATPDIDSVDANNVWRGNSGGQCLTTWSATKTDSIANTLGAPNSGDIRVFATQTGSGTGKDFARLISGNTTLPDASSLATCIPSQFKDGNQDNGERVIFENFAGPICNQTEPAVKNYSNLAIFPYAHQRFVQNNAGTGTCAGVEAKLDGKAPTAATIADTTASGYGYGRYNYMYWSLPSPLPGGFNIDNPSTWGTLSDRDEAVLSYVHPVFGWLCDTPARHSANPVSGTNYRTLIVKSIEGNGASAIASGAVGGGTFTGTSNCRDAASV